MKNRIIQTLLAVVISFWGIAQEVSFTTSVSASKVGVTDRLQVTYSSNKRGNFIAPKFANFQQMSGVSQGSSSNISVVNGQMTQSVTYQYSIILQPLKTGTFKVPGAKIKVGAATYESKPVAVEVVEESQARQRRRPRSIFDQMDEMMRGFPQQQPRQMEVTDKDFFARIGVSKRKVSKGEGLLISYKIYARNFNFGLEKYDFPTHKNFWSENIKIPENVKPTQETIDGLQYQVYTLKKEYVYPQKSGQLKLNAFDITARIQTSPFSPALSKEIKSNAPTIQVEPLPGNAPASFTNQVGDYQMTVELGADSVQVNDPIDLTIKISGKGNLKQLSTLDLVFPEDLEVYDPEVDNKLSVTEGGVKGSKTYNYLIIPRKSGKFKLPTIAFSYFDLDSKSYKTITADQLEITVVNENGKITQEIAKETPEESEKAEEQTISFNVKYLWMGLLGLGIVGVGAFLFLFFIKRKSKEETDEERRRNARKKLAQKLVVAKAHLDKNEVAQFYNETLIGINKYVNEKLNIETAHMTKATIRETLANKSVSESTVNSFVEVLEQCEMAKYAPLSTQNNQEIYEKSLDVIEEMEGQMK